MSDPRLRTTTRGRARLALVIVVFLQVVVAAYGPATGQTPSPLLSVGVDVFSATGSQVTYKIVATNHGSGAASDVVLTNVVPNNTSFAVSEPPPTAASSPGESVCANSGDREPEGTTCRWRIGALAPSRAVTVLMTLDISQTSGLSFTVTNKAEVTSGTLRSDDTDASLHRDRIDASQDTFVVDKEPVDTNHGACTHLRIDQLGRSTAFLRPGPFPSEIETIWGAHLLAHATATSYSAEAPGALAIHRITSGWSEGAGSCQGAPGKDDEPRTGAVPASEPVATAVAGVSAAPSILNWDVTPDLASAASDGAHLGWRVVDESSVAGDHYTTLTAAPEEKARLYLVYTQLEKPTCIDVDPEARESAFDQEPVISATVTDGRRIVEASTGADACDGAPVPSTIDWRIESDSPDSYISAVNGARVEKFVSGGRAGPEGLTSPTDAAGSSTIKVALAEPTAAGNSGTNRISARINSSPDVREKDDPDPTCAVPETPPRCPGEADGEDDVTVTWSAAATPSTTAIATASSSYVRPTKRPPSQRTVTIETPDAKVLSNDPVAVAGEITSENPLCENAGHVLSVRGRQHGTEEFKELLAAATDHEGKFQVSVKVPASMDLVVVAPGDSSCAEAVSNQLEILARLRVTAQADHASPKVGDVVEISGSVSPRHQRGRVILERETRSGWMQLATTRLTKTSRFTFSLRIRRAGPVVLRVRCHTADEDHEPGVSGPIRLEPRRGSQ